MACPAPEYAADSGFLGHIRECSVSIVMKELIAVESGHIQIHKSVIVIVTCRYAH